MLKDNYCGECQKNLKGSKLREDRQQVRAALRKRLGVQTAGPEREGVEPGGLQRGGGPWRSEQRAERRAPSSPLRLT